MSLLSGAKLAKSAYGVFVGETKNGIKVYQKIADGTKTLTSVKNNKVRKVITSKMLDADTFETSVVNNVTGEKLRICSIPSKFKKSYDMKDKYGVESQIHIYNKKNDYPWLHVSEIQPHGGYINAEMRKNILSDYVNIEARTSNNFIMDGAKLPNGRNGYLARKEGAVPFGVGLDGYVPDNQLPADLGNVFKGLWEKFMGKI